MNGRKREELDVFSQPESVAIIGATERGGAWGSLIMEALLNRPYRGKIHVVNNRAETVYGLPAYRDLREIPGPVDLAIVATPDHSVEDAIRACGQKQVRGLVLITAGYGEVSSIGSERQDRLAELARSFNMRILGPNVSGVYNLHIDFHASGMSDRHMFRTPLAAVCQGGYAISDIFAAGSYRQMGVGKFVHTGNECDLNVIDFLEYFGEQKDVTGIMMYVETIRDGRRFLEIARRISRKKPVVVYKAGKTRSGARAAISHTGAMTGVREIYDGLLHQVGVIQSPTMELMLPISHLLTEAPPMKGRRVAVVTMGGSWGVTLTDSLEAHGLQVPELEPDLQSRLSGLGMPARASTKNPVDIGASGLYRNVEKMVAIGREVILSGEVDAMVLHGVGRPGRNEENPSKGWKTQADEQKRIIQGFHELQEETKVPVLIGTRYSPWECQAIYDANALGIRTYDHLDEIAQLLFCLYEYWQRHRAKEVSSVSSKQ